MRTSLFESFNARSLEPEQVGQGFIFSPAFTEVAARSNTVVLGPRGSGKTTLLKMLTLPALNNWRKRDRSKESRRLIESLDYVSIYVPSDFTWYPDFRRPISIKPPKETDDILSYALFRTHVLLAVCQTLDQLASFASKPPAFERLAISANDPKADRFSEQLASAWELEIGVGGLYGLKQSVSKRIRQIQHLLTFTALRSTQADDLIDSHPFLTAQFFDDLRQFADTFDHFYGGHARWSVCFDEIEIAPDPVKLPIWQSARSFDPRFLVKFSASPYDAELRQLIDTRMPIAGHDFRQVDLPSQNRGEISRFSQRMLTGMCAEFKISPRRAELMLGSSFYDDDFDDQADDDDTIIASNENRLSTSMDRSVQQGSGKRLAPNGFYNRKFRSLAKKDVTFAKYMNDRGIDLTDMQSLPEFRKAALIRKILATVVVRDAFLFEKPIDSSGKGRARRFRARKTVPRIYTGATSLFTICEGNPRWLIGLLRPLIAEFASSTDRLHQKRIQRSSQTLRIERTIITLFTLLSTLRTSVREDNNSPTMVEIVERIGNFCLEQVVGPHFNPEPILSFTIDKKVSDDVYSALGTAINQGAMVLVPQKLSSTEEANGDPTTPGDIRGRRVRLSYLLAPRYRLPLVLGRSVDLSPIVRPGEKTKVTIDQMVMDDLFSTGREPL